MAIKKRATVRGYIAGFPKGTQTMLRTIRAAIKATAPRAAERISYGMPYYSYKGRLAYFAGFRDHVSYFVMSGHEASKRYKKELGRYQTGKATLRFPLGTKVPVALIKKLVALRSRENDAKMAAKKEAS